MKRVSPSDSTVGVIGGSGLYEMEGLSRKRRIKVCTPFGPPSDDFVEGYLEGRKVVFLPRHGKGHHILPSEINFRANIYGMKKLGVGQVLSLSLVGSMKKSIAPGDFVLVDQFFDRTQGRASTFFGGGIVAHVAFADPVCSQLCSIIVQAGKKAGVKVRRGGTYLCMEGPQFSTRAESRLYRRFGMAVIGMTNYQEAKLAREAEICYATIAMVTDYDCWNDSHEDVNVDAVLAVMAKNVEKAKALLRRAIPKIPKERNCPCASALSGAILTDRKQIPGRRIRELQPILGKYLSK